MDLPFLIEIVSLLKFYNFLEFSPFYIYQRNPCRVKAYTHGVDFILRSLRLSALPSIKVGGHNNAGKLQMTKGYNKNQ